MTGGEGRRALVVEDDERVREALCDYLAELGYVPEPAASGAEALSRFERNAFRLVVADYKMPGVNGLQVVEEMRTRDPGVVALMVSGYATEFAWQARALGIAVVRKPIAFDVFARFVEGLAPPTASGSAQP